MHYQFFLTGCLCYTGFNDNLLRSTFFPLFLKSKLCLISKIFFNYVNRSSCVCERTLLLVQHRSDRSDCARWKAARHRTWCPAAPFGPQRGLTESSCFCFFVRFPSSQEKFGSIRPPKLWNKIHRLLNCAGCVTVHCTFFLWLPITIISF